MRRLFGSVRAKAALGATAVVAVALVATGIAVLLVLRSNLTGQTDLRAEIAAQNVASQVALDVPYDKLHLPDSDENPVQVVTEHGQAARRQRRPGRGDGDGDHRGASGVVHAGPRPR